MYYLVFFIGIILSIINDKRRIGIIVFTILLALLACFRYGVGADYFSYLYLFNRLDNSIIYEMYYGIDHQEIGFRLLGSLLKQIGFSYQQYLSVLAIINLVFIFKTCIKYSKNPTLSMFLYFCFYYFMWTFSGLRQATTMAIGVYYLLESLEKKNTTKFIIIVLLLSFIHVSALVLIMFYFISKLNFTKKRLIYISIFSIAFSILPIGIILSKLGGFPIINRIMPYLNLEVSLINPFDFQTLGRIIFLVIAFVFYDSYSKQSENSKTIINLYILSFILYFLFKFQELTAARLAIYGKMLDIIILSNIYYMYKLKINKLIYIICLLFLFSLYFLKELAAMKENSGLINSNSKNLVPYTSILNKDATIFNNRFIFEELD